ncbi:hypothetical protein [Gemmatimonas sp. UBA7669]|uniref:hypothetical protein n=1 Tax=Gemmatimonas sp. UBA7669 TaxID=1946568 RepID=UPI0025C5C04B|nr:hypothetical protein [Gemmatimonas sp. UBA7669]
MSKAIWTLTAPDGRVVGASAELCANRNNVTCDCPYAAIHQAIARTSGHRSALERLQTEIDNTWSPTATRYEAAGYVLARGEY